MATRRVMACSSILLVPNWLAVIGAMLQQLICGRVGRQTVAGFFLAVCQQRPRPAVPNPLPRSRGALRVPC